MWHRLSKIRDRYKREATLTLVAFCSIYIVLSQVSATVSNFASAPAVIAYAALLLIADLVLSLRDTLTRARVPHVSPEQDSLMPVLLEAADSLPAGATADLLEYAGVSITPLIRRLKERGVKMRILIKHPETCSRYQRQRTASNLEALHSSVLADYEDGFAIRCYRAPYTLRGRRVGSHFLEVGWLTPDFVRDTAFGRVNPSIYLDPNSEEGADLLRLFSKTFEDLWNHPDTIDGRGALPKEVRAK
jgi:hypothetical protein